MSLSIKNHDQMNAALMNTGMSRRHALRIATVSAAGVATLATLPATRAQAAAGPFTLDALPYPSDALEPHIDAQTMEIHHGRHHAAYVRNLNQALADHPELAAKSIEDLVIALPNLPESIRTAVRNNGGGHLNHALFWRMMKKGGGGTPQGRLARAIDNTFESFAGFQAAFSRAAASVFGSGWAWLTREPGGRLQIETTPNQDCPLTHGRIPLLGVDVWEHAYYLKYQNRRADYVTAFFNVIDWDFVAERFREARG